MNALGSPVVHVIARAFLGHTLSLCLSVGMSMSMSVGAGLSIFLFPKPARAASKILRIEDRTPIAFILNSPGRTIATATHSEIIRKVADLFLAHTDFFVHQLDSAIVGECLGRLSCLAQKARAENHPRYVLMLTSLPIGTDRDRVTALLLDTEKAVKLIEDADRSRPSWKDDAEVSIGDEAVLLLTPRRNVDRHDALMRLLEQIFDDNLSATLEPLGHWEPYGQVVVQSSREGLEVIVDGTSVGTLAAGATEILGLRPGSHRLNVRSPSGDQFEQTIRVRRGATTALDVPILDAGAGEDPSERAFARPVVFWSGLVLAASGAAVLTASILRPDDTVTSCFECSASSTFITTNYDKEAYTHGDVVNPPGLMLAPLGLSMIISGSAWAVGTAAWGDDTDVPWIQLGTGLAAGILTYGVAAALNGTRPESRP
ncbi:MAG: PEGA domain-containing protein [Deltaproteobacteria bacterium]|nr:PEGA domain-containing protein [Deltaproteobacteria bacterium]